MAQMKYEDYVKLTSKQPEMKGQGAPVKARVGYFALKEDGESSIVRFNVASLDDIRIVSKHTVKTPQGKTRIISCLRTDPRQPLDVCPLCEAGERVAYRAYVPLISYEQGEGDEMVAVPALWEQAPKIRETLQTFATEYEDLREHLFKIVRHGKKGDPSTTYTILPANPSIYKDEIFKKDFSAFESLNFERFVATKTADEMRTFLAEGDFPFRAIEPKKPESESKNLEKLIPNSSEEKKVEEALGMKPEQGMAGEQVSVSSVTEVRRPRRYTY